MYRHSADNIRETSAKMFISDEEKIKFNNYENIMRRIDDSYSKVEISDRIKEITDIKYIESVGFCINEKDTVDSHITEIEVFGNTVQNTEDLSDIQSVGEPQGDGTYKLTIKSCGKNLFDGNISVGNYRPDGSFATNFPGVYLTDNFIPVDNTKKYIISRLPNLYEVPRVKVFNENFKNIPGDRMTSGGPYLFGSDVKYVKIQFNNVTDNNIPYTEEEMEFLNNNFMFVQSDTLEDLEEFEHHKCTITDIILPCQLEKVGDVCDRLYYDKREKAWCIEKNVGTVILDGNEQWSLNTQTPNQTIHKAYYASVLDYCGDSRSSKPNVLLEGFKTADIIYFDGNDDDCIITQGTTIPYSVMVRHSSSTVEELKQYLSNTKPKLYHKLKTPRKIILPLSTQISLNSFYGVTNIYTHVNNTPLPDIKVNIAKSLTGSIQTMTNKTSEIINRLENIEGLKSSQHIEYGADHGQIFCSNTKNGIVDNIKICGRSLVNLTRNETYSFEQSGWLESELSVTKSPRYVKVTKQSTTLPNWAYIHAGGAPFNFLKPNTKYTIYVPKCKGISRVTLLSGDGTNSISDWAYVKNNRALITTRSNVEPIQNNIQRIYFSLNTNENVFEVGDVIFLEGDWTDKEISFDHFTGICSVSNGENPIQVKSINENLFNMDDLEPENDRISFTITDNTVNVTKLTEYSAFVGAYIPTEIGETYTINYDYSDIQKEWIYVYSDKPWGTSLTFLNHEYNNRSFIATSNKTYVGLYAGKSVNTNETIYFSNIVVKKQNSGIKDNNYIANKTEIESIFYYDNENNLVPLTALRGVNENTYDSIEKHNDGKWYFHKRCEQLTFDGTETSWWRNTDLEGTEVLFFYILLKDKIVKINDTTCDTICDRFNCYPTNQRDSNKDNNIEGCYSGDDTNPLIQFHIKKSRLSSPDIDGFKAWLKSNNVTIVYALEHEEIYECTPLYLSSYENTTTIVTESSIIKPKIECSIGTNVSDLTEAVNNSISILEEKLYSNKLLNDRIMLSSTYNTDRTGFNMATMCSLDSEENEVDDNLYNLIKTVIEVGPSNYDLEKMEQIIDFYTIMGKISFEMSDELFDIIENSKPVIIEFPEDNIEI